MALFITFPYRNAYYGTFSYDNYDVLNLYTYHTKSYDTKNRLAFLPNVTESSAWFALPNYYYSCAVGSKSYASRNVKSIYFNDGCTTPRSLFRDSGYKIVLDPERADAIIVPIMPAPTGTFAFLVACTKNGDLFLYHKNVPYNQKTGEGFVSVEEKARVETDLINRGFEIIQSWMNSHNCYFYKNCSAFEDVLIKDRRTSNKVYIREDALPINAPVHISVDVLDLWKRCEDDDILDKAICASDWKDYQFTLRSFLRCFKFRFANNSYRSSYFKTIFRVIDCGNAKDKGVVTPKDWNMWQAFCLHLCNVPPEGGITAASSIPIEIQRYIQIKSAVRPVKITEPQELSVLLT